MDLKKGYKMPSTKSTEQVESPTASSIEQRISAAMNTPAAIAAIAASHAVRKTPPSTEPWDFEKSAQQTIANLNRNVMNGL